jgi:hypothetical protein
VSKLGAIFFLFSALSWSQSYTGSIRGTTDNTKAAVPAKVTATDADRNVSAPPIPGPYPADATSSGTGDGAPPASRQPRHRSHWSQRQATMDIELRIGAVTATSKCKVHGPAQHHFSNARQVLKIAPS